MCLTVCVSRDALVGTFPKYLNFEVFRLLGCYRVQVGPIQSHPVQSSPVFSELACFKFQYGTDMFCRNVAKPLLTYAACTVPNIPEQRRRQLRRGGSPKSYIKLSGTSVACCHEGNQEIENKLRVSSVLCSKWQPFEWACHWLCSILFFFLSRF